MKIVFYVDKPQKPIVEQKISQDPVGRQSIVVRDAVSLGISKDGTYVYIDGTDESCNLAREWLKGLAAELSPKEAAEIIKKMEEQDASVSEGIGGMF